MMNAHSSSPLPFDRPAIYLICVRGRIPPDWAKRLDDMTIYQLPRKSEPVITILEGELSDQAALAGVLNTLYAMHLPVLSVQCLTA